MKKKLIASILCLAMVLAIVTPAVFANEEDGVKVVYADGSQIDEDMGVVFPANTKPVIKTENSGSVQWQIAVSSEVWANIIGANDKALTLSYALVANMGSTVGIRCAVTKDGETSYSDVVYVTVIDADESLNMLPLSEEAEIIILDPGSVVVHEIKEPAEEETEEPEEGATAGDGEASTGDGAETPEVTPDPAEDPAEGGATTGDDSTAGDGAPEAAVATEVPSVTPIGETAPGTTGQNTRILRDNDTPDVKKTYNIVVNYVFENGDTVREGYTATLAEGSDFSATVTFPEVLGYLPYLGEADESTTKLDINVKGIDKDYTYTVTYKPTNVDYTVIHYQQNVNDDNYTIESTETKQGLTASQVPEVAKTFEGFYSLLYERPKIAADGSTEIEIYYDRYYYLMNFDMDGGYGTEPVYARYGAEIGTVNDPTKAGYIFEYWMLDGVKATIPQTMPAEHRTYVAKWKVGNPVNYTVVYWKENADDNGYSYWGQQQKTAEAGTKVNGSDDIPQSVYGTEKAYFTYNAARTDTDVVVKGDGSSVVNVYYYRNTYTIYFKGISGTCAIEEHTHGTNCNSYLDCLKEEHTHDSTCERYLSCKLNVHEHTESCTALTCDKAEHTQHTDECLICGKTDHTHSSECCTIPVHTHSTDCWGSSVVGDRVEMTIAAPSNPKDGQVYSGSIIVSWNYIYIKGHWYQYKGSKDNGTIVQPSCGYSQEHQHSTTTCTCSQEAHTHTAECYKDELHSHTDACYGLICGQAAHTHTDACYTYTCSAEEHTHTDSCYRPCTKREHTHANQCNLSEDQNVIYVVTAKYEQNIADVWPTADKFPNITLQGWDVDGLSSNVVSKRVNMTSDLCDTSDGLKYASVLTGGSKMYLYYMFESFDQTSSANGNERILRNGVYYDKSETYYQEVNSNGTWNQKQIYGMTPVNNGVYTNDNNVFLYYTRNRSTLTFYNVNTEVKTVSNIMFEQPLKDYKDSEGKLLRDFKPGYPTSYEPGAYEFAGWYTTPECFDGTEFDFTTATMPNGNLTLYAKWVGVEHSVKFYLKNQEGATVYIPSEEAGAADFTVRHGENIAQEYVDRHLTIEAMNAAKPNGEYTFVMWYYLEGDVKKPFDPTTRIIRDMDVYGEWSSNVLLQYMVKYILQGTGESIADATLVADDLAASGLAGTTRTHEAKGDKELYPAYQKGYFPTVQSQSILLDLEKSQGLTLVFEYVQKEEVPYTVRYVTEETVEAGTTTYGTVTVDGKTYTKLAEDYTNEKNCKAVVTETFKSISGYMPDAYQKRLVVTADGENILYFYYTKDESHAYYKITHYTQNTDGETWTEYASSQAVGDIGTRYTASPMTIPGFTYKEIKYVVNGTEVTDVTTEGAALTADGLEINLYYVRNEYPYQVRYLEQGSGTVLHDPKNGTGKYGQVISESAIDIDGYDKVDPTSATLNIRIDEGEGTPNINIITFYYKEKEVTINYVAVGPEGATNFGSVSPTTETVKVKSGTVQGSTPTAGDGFKFVGWYKDADCTQPVDASWVDADNKLVPQKTDDKNVAATYYAKFEYDITSLTIKKVANNPYDANDRFVFTVTGEDVNLKVVLKAGESVTINGLKVGETYTVTEDTGWSWRYNASSNKTDGEITLTADASENEITFTNTVNNNKYLGDSAYAKNVWGANGKFTRDESK